MQIPSSYHKFTHAFIKGVKVSSASENSKQPYVSATPTSPFRTDEEADLISTRTAEVLFFGRQVLPSSNPSAPPPLLAILFPLDGLGGVSHKSLENRLMSGTTTCLIFNQKMYSLLHSLLFVD